MHGVQTDLAQARIGIDGERHKADDLLPDRDDQYMITGSGCADVIQELCLIGVSMGEGNGGDLRAHNVAE